MECYDVLVSTSEEACFECKGMYSVVNVDTSNRTLALNGRLADKAFETFLKEYLQYKQAYEIKFASFFSDILPKRTDDSHFLMGWPFLNEQAVLQSFPTTHPLRYYEVEQRLEIVEIYFTAPTFDKVIKDSRTNFVTKASMIGGMLGLFTGFSVLSGIEILYFSILLLLRIYERQRR